MATTTENLLSVAPIVGGMASAVAGSVDSRNARRATRNINNKNIQNQWDMYNANNAYNTPLAQRQRMEKAGFNPAMMYGNGTVANTAQASNMPDMKVPEYTGGKAIAEGINSGITQYADIQQKQASQSLMAEQKLLMEKEGRLKEAEILNKALFGAKMAMDTETGAFALKSAKELFAGSLQAQALNIKNVDLENQRKETENSFLTINQRQRVDETTARIANIKSATDKYQIDTAIQQQIHDLRELGIEASDPYAIRMMARALISQGVNPEKAVKAVKEKVQSASNYWQFKNPFNPASWQNK